MVSFKIKEDFKDNSNIYYLFQVINTDHLGNAIRLQKTRGSVKTNAKYYTNFKRVQLKILAKSRAHKGTGHICEFSLSKGTSEEYYRSHTASRNQIESHSEYKLGIQLRTAIVWLGASPHLIVWKENAYRARMIYKTKTISLSNSMQGWRFVSCITLSCLRWAQTQLI